MRLHRTLTSLFPGPIASVLDVVARTDRPLTGRGVAALVVPEMSHVTARSALQHLVEQGLVEQVTVGRAHTYTFNREHLAAPLIEAIMRLRSIFEDELERELRSWEVAPDAAWIFGSVARGEDRAASDIDILVVRPDHVDPDNDQWWSQITDLHVWVERSTGKSCEIVEVALAELEAEVVRGGRLPRDLRSEAVAVLGPHPRDLVRGAPS